MTYQLIKPYPGSPRVGTVVTEYHDGFRELNASGVAVAYYNHDVVQGWPLYWMPTGDPKQELARGIAGYVQDYFSGKKHK